jgi:indole-3-glycerol phosphate synthase
MLQERISRRGNPRGFCDALRQQAAVGTAIIAEVKKGSPSKGIIRANFDPCDIARRYQAGGATCLSVLTDQRFFMGSLAYLEAIAEVVTLPLLRKDFVIDSYQIYEARAAGADAVLLIAAALSQDVLSELVSVASGLDLDVLLEVHNEDELERALRLPVELIGINNRDLKTFHTDLAVTERLMPRIPADRLVVSESGLRCRADIRRLQQAGAGAFLIGESLMREENFEPKLQELLHDQF